MYMKQVYVWNPGFVSRITILNFTMGVSEFGNKSKISKITEVNNEILKVIE